MKKLLLIVNPRAGKTKSTAPLYDAIVRLCEGGYLVNVKETKAAGDATRYALELGSYYDTVVCYGGDGTLNETISGLLQLAEKPLLGYLPAGSTNDFAATLHIPAVPYMAANIITQGAPMALDVGRHNDRYFSYVASFGAFTKASYSAPQEIKNALRLHTGGHQESGLPAAVPLPRHRRRGGHRGGLRFRQRVQLHLAGGAGEAGSQPRADGRRRV